MNVIGISGLSQSLPFKRKTLPGLSAREYYIGQGFDAAAALVTEQGIVAAAAEERFTREKATGTFPINAIRFCLQAGELHESDIDWIAHGFSYEPHQAIFQNDPFTRAQYDEVFSPEVQRQFLKEYFPKSGWAEKFVPVGHHLAHAASAFYPSGFDEALIFVSDGMGEVQSATLAVGQGNDIRILTEIPAFHSLGMLYGVFSLYLGFYMNSDEYKVMGLAPYGNPRRFFTQMLSLVSLRNDGTYTIPAFAHNRTMEERETHRGILRYLEQQFGPPREPESEITQTHKDLAASLQALLQTCQLHVLRHFKRQTGLKNLCLAGGVALNCSTNGVIKRSELFKEVFVQPASGDDGTALGAALWVHRQKNSTFKRPPNTVPLWGPEFTDAEIAKLLDSRKDCRVVEPESWDALCREVAGHLNRGDIVAWFQGRMEFGPRALGSRSILADPRDPTMRDRINALVKKREAFRPFAPVVTAEAAAEIFEIQRGDEGTYAHMLFVTHVRPEYRSRLPATTHVDGSARAQTVSEEQNPRLWKLLNEFAALSNIPVLLNTSFNVRGQPIVCTPQEAIDTFLAAKLDLLVLGNYLVFPANTEAIPVAESEAGPGLEELQEAADRHEEFWVNRLAELDPIVLPYKRHQRKGNDVVEEKEHARPGVLQSAPLPVGRASEALTKQSGIFPNPEPSAGAPSMAREGAGAPLETPIRLDPEGSVAAFAAFLARLCGTQHFHLGFSEARLRRDLKGFENQFATVLPIEVTLKRDENFQAVLASVRSELEKVRARKTFALDLPLRHPSLAGSLEQKRNLAVAIHLGAWAPAIPGVGDGGGEDELQSKEKGRDGACALEEGIELMLVVPDRSNKFTWVYDSEILDAETVQRIAAHFSTFVEALAANPEQRIDQLPVLSQAERKRILVEWNDTHRSAPPQFCIHEAFEAQARKTPEAVALVFEDEEITYRELDERATAMAETLRQRNVGPDTLVGVCLEVSIDMMVALMGVLKAGGAYVPLDPGYPKERIGFMIGDAALPVIITQRSLTATISEALEAAKGDGDARPAWNGAILCVEDSFTKAMEDGSSSAKVMEAKSVTPENLAYVIYTSGSTGKPKGVMLSHANVANFFMAMDARLGTESGVWLAVTSISFDISVLELFWTLARGYKVVLQRRQERGPASPSQSHAARSRPLDFSLFYFAADEAGDAAKKYRLLLEGAKFADAHDFAAVWTPERHFHAFGGLYPNPSITSAALAVATERIRIRAGSVVLPLHHPIRVAEEWAVVDNLSGGRVAISFASGWQINDFVLAPQNHARRKEMMVEQIETVKKLWRGESVAFRDPKGAEVPVKILPRPVQSELPIWITASGNPDTFKLAGELGANVLTHLLGQNINELIDKIRLYREAWKKAGHAGEGQVTLMLHTFVGSDLEQVREIVRGPFTAYLKTSVDLIKNDPWAFSTFKRPANGHATGNGTSKGNEEEKDSYSNLPTGNGVANPKHEPPTSKSRNTAQTQINGFTDEEMNAIAAHAFERHFSTSGLFGTPQHCLAMIEQLRAAGVDEVACLIDFGVEPETVLANLKYLDELRTLASRPVLAKSGDDYSVASRIRTHSVTHLQCTPPMASMLAEDPKALEALRSLKKLLLGGEALPGALIDQLQFPGEILNMYGPTETTIWSATHRVDSSPAIVPIGRPIANTDIYIVDQQLEPQPIGIAGEILIGGAGVARGYLNRPELTAERFIPNPFKAGLGERVYRTGDLARYLPDGTIEFLGRLDHQVKLRGFRIELGEIEAVFRAHPSVKDCVCLVREDVPGDKRLIAYLIPAPAESMSPRELREYAHSKLPEYMVPSAYVALGRFPLTPNGKVDRKALPRPTATVEAVPEDTTPASPTERIVRETMCEVLGVAQMSLEANFFELGGNSLLATQLIGRLRPVFGRELPLRLAFEHPTAATLAKAIDQEQEASATHAVPEHEVVRPSNAVEKPLSFAQQRIWFLHQLEPGSHYNDHFDLRIDGPLQARVLEQAINEIVKRHEVMRATFDKQDGNPVQKIADALAISLPSADLSHFPRAEGEREAERLAIQECNKPFDLREGPLFRALLIKLAEEHHILVLTFDHIIIDGWSHGVFLSELSAFYQASFEGRQALLPALPLQYSDFAAWQAQVLEGEETRRHLTYWKKQLAGAPSLLGLPTDRPRPNVPSYRGGREMLVLDREMVAKLTGLGRAEGCTLFMVLLGAFQTLLGRYAESEDVLVGSPIANRNRTEIESLIGSFMNTLVLRGDLRGDPAFRELLRRTRKTALDAYTHQDLPFEKLVAELQPARNLSHSPLFQVMFILQNTPMPAFECGSLRFSPYEVDAGSSKLDLTLNLEETGEGCQGWIEYASDLFDRSSIARMIRDFKALLGRIIDDPARSLSELTASIARAMEGRLSDHQPARGWTNLAGSAAVPAVSVQSAAVSGVSVSTVELAPSRRADLPSTQVEKELARIWGEVLGVGQIGLNDNLFDLGGHSLLVTRIISRIRKAFDVEVPIHAFFETPTVGAISQIIEQEKKGGVLASKP